MISTLNTLKGWQKIRLKRIAKLNPSKSEVSSLSDDTDATFLPMEAVSESWEVDYSRTRPFKEVRNGYTYFRDGDILIAKITPCFENGKGALVNGCLNGFGFGTTEFHVVRSPNPETTSFLSYVFRSYRFKVEGAGMMTGTAGQKRLSDDYVKDFEVFLPSLSVQGEIACFLDRKTAAIDTLIAKKQRLIQLLEEKRLVLINHAVTKGLNPNAPMKDSGISWIGEVPEHWEVCELRRKWDVIDCKHKTPEYIESGYSLVSTTEVKPGKIDLSIITRYISEENFFDMTESRLPRRGDLIYSRNASLGSAAYVDTDELFAMGQDVVLITSQNQDQLYLSYYLNSKLGTLQVDLACVGSTFRRINVGQIRQILITVPPIQEQTEIGRYLERLTEFFEKNISFVGRQIEKLQEYRRSLITAAVTGKLEISEVEPDV
jgi:type I restriction enzyme, S subunit